MMPSDSTSARTWSGSLPLRRNLRRNTAMFSQPNGISQFLGNTSGTAGVVTSRNTWLVPSAVVAVAVYALMWIGYASQWNWLSTVDSSWLDIGHRYAVAHPGRVTAWNVF